VRSRTRWKRVLAAIAAGNADEAARALVDDRAPLPLERAPLAGRFALPGTSLTRAADLLADRSILTRLGERAWIERGALEALALRARELVLAHLQAFPLDRGMPLETLRAKLARASGRDAAERAIQLAQKDARTPLTVEADVARIGASALDAELAKRLRAARDVIDRAGKQGTGAFAVGEATGATAAEVRAILAHLVRDGVAMQAGDLWFSPPLVEEMRRLAESHLKRSTKMSVIEFKEISGLARKQAILLLEHFDRLGLTRRVGDNRVLR
jgi:selenocysteine-specific elongation factor